MKRLLGIIFLAGGLVASLIFAYQAYEETESVKILGSKITLSTADWAPLMISGAITFLGIILIASHKKS